MIWVWHEWPKSLAGSDNLQEPRTSTFLASSTCALEICCVWEVSQFDVLLQASSADWRPGQSCRLLLYYWCLSAEWIYHVPSHILGEDTRTPAYI